MVRKKQNSDLPTFDELPVNKFYIKVTR